MLIIADVQVPSSLTNWSQVIGYVLWFVAVTFLIPWLKAEAAKTKVERGAAIADRLKSFLWGTAEAIAEQRFPKLAEKVQAGEIRTSTQVKDELYGWGRDLKVQALQYFEGQGIDILKEVGEKAVDSLIRRAADDVSPLPGMETAKAMLTKSVVDAMIDKGVDYVKAKAHEFNCKGCIPVCAGCPKS
jgi:hypothetical protein